MYESGVPEERRDAQVLAVLQEVQGETSRLGGEVARLRRRVDTPSSSTTGRIRAEASLLDRVEAARQAAFATDRLHSGAALRDDDVEYIIVDNEEEPG